MRILFSKLCAVFTKNRGPGKHGADQYVEKCGKNQAYVGKMKKIVENMAVRRENFPEKMDVLLKRETIRLEKLHDTIYRNDFDK